MGAKGRLNREGTRRGGEGSQSKDVVKPVSLLGNWSLIPPGNTVTIIPPELDGAGLFYCP